MDLQGLATQGAAGTALGAATAGVVKFLKNLLKIFALIQIGILTALAMVLALLGALTLMPLLILKIKPFSRASKN